jgi:hypothetical protein
MKRTHRRPPRAPLTSPNKERRFIPWMNHGGFRARFSVRGMFFMEYKG